MGGFTVHYLDYDIPESVGDLTALRFDLYGSVMVTDDIGLHGQLLYSSVTVEPPHGFADRADDEDASSLWGVVLGAHYVARQHGGTVPISLSLALPNEPDDFNEAAARIFTVYSRVYDVVAGASKTTWVRLATSPRHRMGAFELRADVGLDVPVPGDDAVDDVFLRLGFAASADVGDAVALMVESSNLVNLGEFDDDNAALNTLSIGARYIGHMIQPGLHVSLPLDDEIEDELTIYHFSLRVVTGG